MLKVITLFVCLSSLLIPEQSNNSSGKKVFSFEKIIFHTTACYGFCPVYHLQLTQDKHIQLFTETAYTTGEWKKDTSKTGYFIGYISDSVYTNLVNELSSIDLDNLEFNNAQCCDGSVKTIIVYYNGKRKVLRSMFPPDKARKLISMLYTICSESSLPKTTRGFYIENEHSHLESFGIF